MIRIALCDDEQEILDAVSQYIQRYADSRTTDLLEIHCFQSANGLLSALEDHKTFDIFVLDVYIGSDMGTALAKKLRRQGIESPIIFLTTSIEHAPESFETGTLRYLIKPIKPTKFYEAMDVALASAERIGQRLIKFKTENGVASVNANHIMYSEAHDHYQYMRKDDGEEIKVRMTVTELFTMLSKYGGFVRIGSAYIINLRHVKNVTPTNVCLYNNYKIQIPRGKFTEIKNTFWNFQCEGQED